MALAAPDSRFVGIDLSPRQIADGQSTLDQLALRNVVLGLGRRCAREFGRGQNRRHERARLLDRRSSGLCDPRPVAGAPACRARPRVVAVDLRARRRDPDAVTDGAHDHFGIGCERERHPTARLAGRAHADRRVSAEMECGIQFIPAASGR
jgi:hypothetical protein